MFTGPKYTEQIDESQSKTEEETSQQGHWWDPVLEYVILLSLMSECWAVLYLSCCRNVRSIVSRRKFLDYLLIRGMAVFFYNKGN